MRKFLIYFVIFLLAVIFAAVISLRFFPKLYVSAFNHFSQEKISTKQIDINFIPLEINIGNLDITNAQQEKIIMAEKVKLSAQLEAWYHDKQNFWKASVANADIQLFNLPKTSEDSQSSKLSTSKINIHKILSGLDIKIDEVKIRLD